jgi:hypothetical protein
LDKIFVKIASYRDEELPKTIESALRWAKFPERLSFGIAWQYDEKTLIDLDPYIDLPNFRITQTYYANSHGCCWARHQTDELYQGEKYMLQIDAHTRFAQNWDERYINMLESLPSDKPVLSTYPAPFIYINGKEKCLNDRGIQKLECKTFHEDLSLTQFTKPVEYKNEPIPSEFLAAGQLFAHGHFCETVKYDPNMYFSGEEISLAARAYTHGYDFFCPTDNLMWHLYDHSMPLHTDDHQENQHSQAIKRLHNLLTGSSHKLGTYGLGKVRTLNDYEKLCGLNFTEKVNYRPVETRF